MTSDVAQVPAGSPSRQAASLKFFYGPMDCGKSTLALQMNHNHARQGRRGLLLTKLDRSGTPKITSRIGWGSAAVEVQDDMDLGAFVSTYHTAGERIDYLICDEAQFYTLAHVEQLADLVDHCGIDVYAFGLATDFRSELFPASRRLLELADQVCRLQVEVLCWCGREGAFNARIVNGVMMREGEQVIIGDTCGQTVRYQVMCRRHYRSGQLGPVAPAEHLTAVSVTP